MKEKNIRKRIKTEQKGITLIALVITIIVLLILAGVAISSLSGDGNIMKKAQDASNRTKEAEELEKVQMAVVNTIAEGNTGTVSNENNLLKNKLQAMGLDVTTFGTSVNDSWKIQGSTGQWYQIYANGKVERPESEPSDTTVALTGITLNPTSANLKVGETVKIGVKLTPSNTTESGVTYKVASGGTGVATVSETGLVTAVGAGDTTITVAGKETTGVKETFTVTVSNPVVVEADATGIRAKQALTSEYTWDKLNELAGIISNTNTITKDTEKVKITQNGTDYYLVVGDTTTVTFNGTSKGVRILGFNHDTLASDESKRAGISFEFTQDLGTSQMNWTNTNSGGWNSAHLKNGYSSGSNIINGLDAYYLPKLNISSIIKEVKKVYNPNYSATTTSSTTNDKLWLLSASEIFTKSGSYYGGYAAAQEGERYKYYALGNSASGKVSSGKYWWLRSPIYSNNGRFCIVYSDGSCCNGNAYNSHSVVPGFSI